MDATNIGCSKSYNNTPTSTLPRPNTTILHTKTHNQRRNPRGFIYTDGSQVKGNPTLGAGVVNPRSNSITHIDIKSQPGRHTIKIAELAAIAVALKHENTEDHMSILTDNSSCINIIRNYTTYPAAYNQHLHKDLLQLTNQLLKDRESKQLKPHIGKVKSHTDMEYNETADTAARAVVDGENTTDITFEDTDPPIRGLRT
jgi:ribonuclease HI